MMYDLPITLTVCGVEYEIRSDYRAVLDICAALSDGELSHEERLTASLEILYPAIETMPHEHYKDAIEMCFWFVRCGEEEQMARSPKLVDWEQDFKQIIAPINRVLGQEARAIEYMHWWTFISAYYEIGGDCTFAQIVGIRDKLARGKSLDKSEREWYRRNRRLVDFRKKYTEQEDELLAAWGVGKAF